MSRTSAAVREAVRVNAEREHFTEAYEGFNDCPAARGEPCTCGKAEAEVAWRAIKDLMDHEQTVTGWPRETSCPRCGRTAVILSSTMLNASYECRGDPDPATNSAYAPDACVLVFQARKIYKVG